ncbi:CDP-glycerol glycerophosphotransferase family protein [Lacticaseibacillus mingshuiensis]|uniref:CDP-glycerol glycerophosphotransferase family protein n=1 Tax=Lacticaseibacillus mingshuiensis TaxID=2799574 RepID=A0ABW4CG56_9LACO|nr:CDP-glycerol glycerophosphotransferase family protein [Lacticaseibacillus mingshuiensis]
MVKQNLDAYTTADGLLVIKATTPLPNIRVIGKKTAKTVSFTDCGANRYQLTAAELDGVLEVGIKDRADILFGEAEPVSTDDFTFCLDAHPNALAVKVGDDLVSLYVAFDGKLRLIHSLLPSIKTYLTSWQATTLGGDSDGLRIGVEVTPRYLALSSVQLQVRVRDTDRVYESTAFPLSELTASGNQTAEICFSPESLFSTLFDKPDQLDNTYDTSLYDVFIRFSKEGVALARPWLRLSAQEAALPTETTIVPYKPGFSASFYWYLTLYGNLSFRETVIPEEAVSYLQQMPQETAASQRPIVLVCEYPEKAQDNGLAFFKYLQKHEQKNFESYYLISRDSPDLKNLADYRANVVFYRSKEHFSLFRRAQFLCHSHSSIFALPMWRNDFLTEKTQMHKIFLQHGITAAKNVSWVYGKTADPNFTDMFLVCSERERQLVIDEMGYLPNEVAITGFARFDKLLRHRGRLSAFRYRNSLLVMPTWRQKLVKLSDTDFMQTDFYQQLSHFLASKELAALDFTVDLYLHHNFQKFSHLFHAPNVRVISEDEADVQQLLLTHGTLVTDYSSVGIDFALLGRPVVYYQFAPENDHLKTGELYLPGPAYAEESQVIDYLATKRRRNVLDDQYRTIVEKSLYEFRDTKACKRIVDVMKAF